MIKESPLTKLSGKYLAALRTHVGQDPQVGLQVAWDLGKAAVSIGLETLDLAKVHDHALVALRSPELSSVTWAELSASAAIFFTEAITPIEETHCAAREATADLNQLNATLDERTLDLADSNRKLRQQITGRTKAEAALRNSELAFGQLLQDSRDLEQHLQKVAHEILAATEIERKSMSLQLNDEIAQTLLGINIRLLALKEKVAISHNNLNQEITTTQRLVEESVIIINRLAHEFSSHHEQPAD